MARIALASLLIAAAGCSMSATTFAPSTDAEPGDGPSSSMLAIVPSVTALTVDEPGNKEFTVTLNHAPAAPLTVQVDSPSSAIGLTLPDLTFDETTFAQPRTIIVTGLVDVDVADAEALISLTATGVDPVTVTANVDDKDIAELVTNLGANTTINIDDGQSVDVKIHLSHKPAADVTVMAILGTGPCTVNGATRVFTPDNYDVDQTFRFTSVIDVNATNDDQPLTLRIDNTDRLFTLHEIDGDILNATVAPTSITVTEGGTPGNLNVALSQMPAGNITVTVGVVSQTGVITVDKNSLQFTPANYQMNQTVKVTGAQDADIEDDTAQVRFTSTGNPTIDVTVNVNIDDDDQQEILDDVTGPLNVDENSEITFNVTLKQMPSANITVAVQSLATSVATVTMGGSLTFTPADYNMPHPVRIKGTHDQNLAPNSTKIRMFVGTLLTEQDVVVADIDQQEILVSTTSLNVAEGAMGSFDVSLRFEPLTTVNASVTGTNNTALPFTPPTLTFTTANYAQAHTVMVTPPIDTNAVGESSTLTIAGAGAAQSKTVMANVTDPTDIDTWGWPTPFPTTTEVSAGFAIAYKLDVGAVANLDSFHTYVPTAVGSFRMALYTDAGTAPGTLVAEMPAGKVLVNGINDGPILLDPVLMSPTYYLVVRFSSDVNIGYAAAGTTGRQCFRNLPYSTISDPWSTAFGASTCATDRLMNMWITTYHQ